MPIYKVEGKKNGKQKYKVRVNYVSDRGIAKQFTRTAYGYSEAKDLEERLKEETKKNGIAKRIIMRKLFNEYAQMKQFEIRETSLDKYKRNYNCYIEPFFGDVPLNKVNVVMIQSWKLSIERKGLSERTKQHAYGNLRALLNYAVRMEYIDKNPMMKVGNFKKGFSGKKRKEMNYYTSEEFIKFIEMAKLAATEKQEKQKDLSEWHFYVFFNIAFYTGLRKGEIHALKWSDIDGAYLTVDRSIAQKLRGEDRETLPKNQASLRTLQMPLSLTRVLDEHKKRQELLRGFSNDKRVCGRDRCLRDSTVQKRNVTYAKMAGLKVIRIHDFRHSHVSVLANAGINIQEIARRLGHAKVEETWNTYSHMYPKEEEKAVDVLDKI